MLRWLLAAAKRRYAEGQIASLTRQLNVDVNNHSLRRSVVDWHCKRADVAPEVEEEALQEVKQHLEVLLRECRDVLLLHDVLCQAVGPKLFYKMPTTIAQCMRKIGLDKMCMDEFGTRSCFEERATQYHVANALNILKACGENDAAKELFQEALELEWEGKKPITWTSMQQTPAVHIGGLEHLPFWDNGRRPQLAYRLEDLWEPVQQDLNALLKVTRPDGNSIPAYPALVSGAGDWDMLQLYVNKKWDDHALALLPRSRHLLRGLLPSADLPYVHYNTEEVVLFRLTPGSKVRLHNGGSNVPINMSLGLRGCEGSWIEVAGEARPFQEGKVVCFDDGSDHRVWHDGEQDRWVLVVRAMHPDLVSEPRRYFRQAFTRRTCFESWGVPRAFELGGLDHARDSTPQAATDAN